MMLRRHLLVATLLASAAPLLAGTAVAQTAAFPSRAVTLVVPFTANSGSDMIARIVGPQLSARWGQPVVVENRPGASGNMGSASVAKAPADGHTLLMAINTFTMAPSVYKTMPFDPVGDFTPIAKLGEASYALAVNASFPAKDLAGAIAQVRKTPGKVNYASPGNGTPQHLAMELLKADQHIDLVHVPYKGISGALTDLMGGQVEVMFGTVHSLRSAVQSGKVRLLAVTGTSRHALAPEVPTFKEQGVTSMDAVDAWYAVLGPGHMAAPLQAKLNADFLAVMNSPETKNQLAPLGVTVRTSSPTQLATLIKDDLARWRKVVTDASITAD